jgi:hypothetical protein
LDNEIGAEEELAGAVGEGEAVVRQEASAGDHGGVIHRFRDRVAAQLAVAAVRKKGAIGFGEGGDRFEEVFSGADTSDLGWVQPRR